MPAFTCARAPNPSRPLIQLQVFRRDEAVDLEILDGGFTVGSIVAGEFLRYTVDVTRDGTQYLNCSC